MRAADYGVLWVLLVKQLSIAVWLSARFFKNWLLDYLNKVFRGVRWILLRK